MKISGKGGHMKYSPLPPQTILANRYRISHLIGKGGMGATYQGEDRESGQKVAIKELVDLFETPAEREFGVTNFLAEMGVLKLLHHPQIPRILDHFLEKRGFFFVLEFVEGKDMAAAFQSRNRVPLPEQEVIRIGIHVCRILNYLHRHFSPPIVHKDIKPANLMERESDRRIMLVDFGISKAAKPREGLMIGTPGYAPPEQHRNQAEPRSDLYSLAVTLHELSTGIPPGEKNSTFPPEVSPPLSPAFIEAIRKALQYSPDDRYTDAYSFEKGLQALLHKPIPHFSQDLFEKSSREFAQEFLFPWLAKVRKEYGNDCQTNWDSSRLDYFSLTLQAQVPHVLRIKSNRESSSLAFFLKEGLLSPTLLGEINPQDRNSWKKAGEFLRKFLLAYRQFKGEIPRQS